MPRVPSPIRIRPLLARLKRWIDAFYEFDERLAGRMQNSRAVAIALLSFCWLCLLTAAAVVWIARDETDIRIETLIGLALATGGLVLLARPRLRQQLLKQRMKAGLCIHCGYDLRASAGVCPECGSVPTKDIRRKQSKTRLLSFLCVLFALFASLR